MTGEAAFAGAQVLSQASPELDQAWVGRLALSRWGIAGTLEALSGERDRNYRLTRAADGARFVLKLSHPAETALIADFQTQALLHLVAADPGLPVQRIVPALDGAAQLLVDPGCGSERVARVFSYLPGTPLPEAPRTRRQQQNLAQTLARLDLALRGFSHPAADLPLPWDLQRAESVRELLVHIEGEDRIALATKALDRFEQEAKPLLRTLARQAIHNDFNIYNVLVDGTDTDRIAGILDFGDMVHAPCVNDLAVAAAYQVGSGDDPLASIVAFVAAYHAVRPLSALELELLFTLITARLVMVVAISGWRAARYPENAAYLMRNNALSWLRLQACERVGPAAATAAFRRACAS